MHTTDIFTPTKKSIAHNTVSARNQAGLWDCVYFMGDTVPKRKVLIFGNSITLHGPKEEIGWYGHWGMAASSKEKDYVHRLFAMVEQSSPRVQFCVLQNTLLQPNTKHPLTAYHYHLI